MIYAIGSIGLLGFLVWSQMMAFHYCEIMVINITICWNGAYLLVTFNSLNTNILSQSAGNLDKLMFILQDSSETTRDDTYDLFKSYYKLYYKDDLNNNWLDWFIGFSEGNAAILYSNNNCRYVLTHKDYNILYLIHNYLGIGYIKLYKKDNKIIYGRYIVSDTRDCLLLYLLFNGNLRLTYRINQLNNWYNIIKYHKLYNNNMNINYINKEVTLNDAWLSGLTDAQGSYSITKYKNNKITYIKCKYILNLKDELILNKISKLLNSNSLARLNKNINNIDYRIEISCNHYERNKTIINYLNKYKLKTSKLYAYNIFKVILSKVIDKQPVSNDIIKEINTLRKSMNKYILLNRNIGYKSKS